MEDTLQHLGPSAQPLLSFLYRGEAANLLTTSKYIAELVSAYETRWGFKKPIFTKDYYGYRINSGMRYSVHPELQKGVYFLLEIYPNKASRLWTYKDGRIFHTLSLFFDPEETVQIASEIRAHGYRLEIKN